MSWRTSERPRTVCASDAHAEPRRARRTVLGNPAVSARQSRLQQRVVPQASPFTEFSPRAEGLSAPGPNPGRDGSKRSAPLALNEQALSARPTSQYALSGTRPRARFCTGRCRTARRDGAMCDRSNHLTQARVEIVNRPEMPFPSDLACLEKSALSQIKQVRSGGLIGDIVA